jgi:hypothetical protein
MLDGITIISSSQVVTDTMLNLVVAYGCFLFIMIMCICVGIWRYFVDKIPFKRAKIWIFVGLAAGLLIGCLIGKFVMPEPTEYTTVLKVQLDDSITIGDLREHYIINRQDGNYYYLESIKEEE